MNEKYNALFTPWKIGNVEIKNRIVQCSMGGTSLFGWMEPNHFDKEAAYFLLNRAQDGVGLILPGMQCIRDPLGIPGRKWLYQNDQMFKQLKEYMVEFHKTGAKLFIQLAAGMGRSMAINGWMTKLAKNNGLNKIASPIVDVQYICASASEVPNRWKEDVMSRPLTVKEIEDMVYAFGQTAKKLRAAGVDGVEIHAVHEGYTLADAQGRLNMYPRLVRDNRGGLIHLLTNTTCPYRRNGTRLPYGSGELAGVIVHERFPQYEYVDTADDLANGIIGSYQIRHMSFADIRFAEDRSQSFSETLTEYCYVKGKAAAADGYAYWYPTWGTNGRFTQTASKSAYPNGVYNAACWHYLGWCGTARGTAPFRSHIGNDGYSGFGVILEDGTNYAVKSTAVNTDGKGTDQANWLAWVTTYWWNASTDRPYAWVVEFSTAGLSSDRVSLIMSVQSGRATLNAGPYFWKVQWSATGDYESDEGWFDVEATQTAPDGSAYTFTQPDFPVFATQRSWQLPAYKQVEIPLPAEIMGREKVWLRIQPASRLSSGLGFLDGTIPMGYNAAGAMDYLAVRYNR